MATYKETYKLWILTQNLKKEKKEEAKFINNQLECFFFFFFSFKIKYIYNFPNQNLKHPKTLSDHNFHKIYNVWLQHQNRNLLS